MTRASDTAKLLGAGATILDGTTISTADNTDQLILKSTDADANVGPNLNLYRNSGSPADNDVLGLIIYNGRNDNSQDVIYARQISYIKDASDGTEDGQLTLQTMVAGTIRDRLNINPTEIVLNEDSQDLDFRVESNANANMLFVNGGDNNVTMQSTSAGAATAPLVLHNASSNANTDVRMYLAPCTTAADRPVILSAKNNGGNVVDFGISTPNGGTPVQRVTVAGSDGTIDVETGNIFFSTAGKGVYLGVTSETASNLLDDYEEGTWTPAYSTTNGSFGYDAATAGIFTKIGNTVSVSFRMYTASATVGTGNVIITGLPFTPTSSYKGAGSIGDCRNFAGDHPSTLSIQANGEIRPYYRTSANGANQALQASDLSTGATKNLIDGQITYQV